ncbi:MAG: hypothetical protein K2G44_01540 [Clostridia bacterium]|nr:hypothetical protein [Clostridia bacterium]
MNVYETVAQFYNNYEGEKCVIGKSVLGRELFAFFVGDRSGKIGICQYAIHAREWITAHLALEHIRRGVKGGVWFIPLMNPDGALLATEGLESVESEERRAFLARFKCDFSLWKANAEGVDLNVNFPAEWGTGRSNVHEAAPANYIGELPLSAPESRALAEFTISACPDYTISWHTKGEEIYWRFHQPFRRACRDKRLAKRLSRLTGYPLRQVPYSAGGYKDWCVQKLKIPAFTVEAGSDCLCHPIGLESLERLVAILGNTVREFTEGF